MTALDFIRREKLIAIARGIPLEQILPLAEALYDGGVRVLEIPYSMNEDDGVTAEAVRMLCGRIGGRMCIGAGTVLRPEQAETTRRMGGQFIVSPDVCGEVIRKTRELGMVSIPGALTPTEIMTAHRAGADMIKLFPVTQLGVSYVKALRAPLSAIPFAAVGGVSPENIPEYRKAGIECFGVGGGMIDRNALAGGDYASVTALAKKYVEAVQLNV